MQDGQTLCNGHFNSIKVRLKLVLPILFKHLLIFQFHKGTIKTLIFIMYSYVL